MSWNDAFRYFWKAAVFQIFLNYICMLKICFSGWVTSTAAVYFINQHSTTKKCPNTLISNTTSIFYTLQRVWKVI